MKYEKDWIERVAIAANEYVKLKGVDEAQIDGFVEFLFRVYGYTELLKSKQFSSKFNNNSFVKEGSV